MENNKLVDGTIDNNLLVRSRLKQLLFVLAGDPEAGAPHQVMAALWLHARGYAVEVLSMGPSGRTALVSPLGTIANQTIPTGGGLYGKLVWHLRLFAHLLRARFSAKPTIIYLQGHGVTPAACFALLGMTRSRIIYHTQDYLEPVRHPLRAFWEKILARRAGAVICNESNRARFMASSYRLRHNPLVVRTALPRQWPIPVFDPRLREAIIRQSGRQPSADLRLILHQGGFSPVRCTSQLLEAMALLPPEYLLVFTGTSRDSASFVEGERLAGRLGLAGRIIYLDRLSFAELLQYTACCDIGILLYPDDGIGNYYQAPGRLTEYLGCGLPVVTSNFPGLELLVLKYDIGAACDPTSPVEIASAIRGIGDREANWLHEERGRLRALAKSEFAYENQVWRIEKILNEAGNDT